MSGASIDHLVGAGEQHRGHLEAERPRRFEVDDQLVLRWRLHRQIGWLLAFQDAVDVTRSVGAMLDVALMVIVGHGGGRGRRRCGRCIWLVAENISEPLH